MSAHPLPATPSTVLVIDEAADNLAHLHAVLGDAYKVKVANGGERGLAIAQGERPPDLILLAVAMTTLDGFDTCRRLKADPGSRDIPVILMADPAAADAEARAFEAGADDCVRKPIHPAGVLRRVDVQLRLRGAEREVARLRGEPAARTDQAAVAPAVLDRFESAIAHDLRSSLSVVSGYAALLRRKHEGGDDAQALQFLSSIRDSARQANLLAGHWRETARVLRQPLQSMPVDMTDLVQRVLGELLDPRGPEPVPQVVVEALPRVWADAPALKRVWTELVRNALAFARPGEGARVRIHGEPGVSEHVFCIDDEGIGWEPGDEERVFEPMERLAPHAEGAGAGLGLFVARQTVLRLGGRMWAEAQPNQGARVRFALPAAAPV